MKFKLIIPTFLFAVLTLFSSCSKAQAGLFNNRELDEQKQKIIQVEKQLDLQRQHSGGVEVIAAGLALASILLFVIGTALGSKTRHRHALQSTRA